MIWEKIAFRSLFHYSYYMKKIFYILLSIYCVVGLFSQNEVKEFKIVFSESNPPFSYESSTNEVTGLIPDMVELMFSYLPERSYKFYSYPWKRAQVQLKNSFMDMFCTYPSESRKEYAFFTEQPLLYLEYNYIIFSKNNKKLDKLLAIRDITDLNNFIFLSHSSSDWEEENIPKSVSREYVNKHDQLLHLLFKREVGDFFIMNLEEAIYLASKYGYKDQLMYTQVDFIPDSTIPFHLGVRKSHYNATAIIKQMNKILSNESFVEERKTLMDSYH